jgi:hypothetical protein
VVTFLQRTGGTDYPSALGCKEFCNCFTNGATSPGYYCHFAIKSARNEPPWLISNVSKNVNVSEIGWFVKSLATFGQNDKLALAQRKQRKRLAEIPRGSNESPYCSISKSK